MLIRWIKLCQCTGVIKQSKTSETQKLCLFYRLDSLFSLSSMKLCRKLSLLKKVTYMTSNALLALASRRRYFMAKGSVQTIRPKYSPPQLLSSCRNSANRELNLTLNSETAKSATRNSTSIIPLQIQWFQTHRRRSQSCT